MSSGVGSSPHTRGARSSGRSGRSGRRDHPRIRGEHALRATETGPLLGSSPHTRGARRADPRQNSESRIIPAYAGSTDSGPTLVLAARDHPRIRGEHESVPLSFHFLAGSSPHTRGALTWDLIKSIAKRIIPAYAGSTGVYLALHPPQRDHPRIRGEHNRNRSFSLGIRGSSPHTRGARYAVRTPARRRRIIPAYAGSTGRGGRRAWTSRDHPRIRGEHSGAITPIEQGPGSSPHTRGAPSLLRGISIR